LTFRARAGAAPLKPSTCQLFHRRKNAFRARAGAAPLKHKLSPHRAFRFLPIPRPRGRGPVEADDDVNQLACVAFIPRPRGRGPVEAFFISMGVIGQNGHSAPARARPR